MIQPMLAHTAPPDLDPAGWWMTEKLDGVRAIWKGCAFMSRNWNRFFAPATFLDGMPTNLPLDGELYMGRQMFQSTVSKVRRHDDPWVGLKYVAFDTFPTPTANTYEERLDVLRQAAFPPQVEVLYPVLCTGRNHLISFHDEIKAQGGEGVMLRRAGSAYTSGRSWDLLKVKTVHMAEAVVVDHLKGQGKYWQHTGSLLCSWGNKIFQVGTGLTDDMRIKPPPVGSIITFSYFELTRDGNPRFPVFVAVRDYE